MKKLNRRIIENAIAILAIGASNAGDLDRGLLTAWRALHDDDREGAADRCPAYALASSAFRQGFINTLRIETGRVLWSYACAEAEALLRTGWRP